MKFLDTLKEDIKNLQILFEERDFKPFLRPIIVILGVFLVVQFFNNNAKEKVNTIKKRIEAQQAEAENERDYKDGKIRYQNLLAQLPPADRKNEWILLQVEAIANKLNIKDSIKYSKGANLNYGIMEISTAVITGELTYSQVGRLVESIENNPQFLRINKLSLDRKGSSLGKITIRIEIYTAFLEEHKMVETLSGRKK